MKAMLSNGSVIELKKDCECLAHDGPHWLHTDETRRLANKKLLEMGSFLACQGFAVEEQSRLRDKMAKMQALGIAEIIFD